MLAKVHEHVDKPVPNLPRRPERPHVVPVPPDRPPPPQRPVDRPRQPDRQPPCPRPQPRRLRLDDQMHVIPLHGEMHHAKRLLAGGSDRLPDRAEHHLSPQRRQPGACPQGEVHGESRPVFHPRPVWYRPPAARDRRPSRALPFAAPAGGLWELQLPRSRHLEWGNNKVTRQRVQVFRVSVGNRFQTESKRPTELVALCSIGGAGWDVDSAGAVDSRLPTAPWTNTQTCLPTLPTSPTANFAFAIQNQSRSRSRRAKSATLRPTAARVTWQGDCGPNEVRQGRR